MAHFLLLLLPLIQTVSAQYASTNVDISNIIFNGYQFMNYFPNINGNGYNVQLECHASTGSGQAVMLLQSKSAGNMDTNVRFDDVSFELRNPADWITITCSIQISMLDDQRAPHSVIDVTQLFAAADNDQFAPNSFPKAVTPSAFPDHPEWLISGSINKRCSNGNSNNFNCDDRCQFTTCSNGAQICCTDQIDQDKCVCFSSAFISTTAPPNPPNNNNNDEYCKNEDLYFWIMIGLACLAGLLLILLIICLSYICCALSSEDEARKAQQAEPVRPPPPVYLSTPPRDPRYGYRGPTLDPYGRPEAGYREEYGEDFDSIAAEWNEASERREARV